MSPDDSMLARHIHLAATVREIESAERAGCGAAVRHLVQRFAGELLHAFGAIYPGHRPPDAGAAHLSLPGAIVAAFLEWLDAGGRVDLGFDSQWRRHCQALRGVLDQTYAVLIPPVRLAVEP